MAAAQARRSAGTLAMAVVIDAWLQGRRASPGQAASALDRAQAALAGVTGSLDDDDRAACQALMAQLADRAGQAALAESMHTEARALREQVFAAFEPHRAALLALQADAAAVWPAA